MIAISASLLGGLDTTAALAAKKDGEVPAFADTFERASASGVKKSASGAQRQGKADGGIGQTKRTSRGVQSDGGVKQGGGSEAARATVKGATAQSIALVTHGAVIKPVSTTTNAAEAADEGSVQKPVVAEEISAAGGKVLQGLEGNATTDLKQGGVERPAIVLTASLRTLPGQAEDSVGGTKNPVSTSSESGGRTDAPPEVASVLAAPLSAGGVSGRDGLKSVGGATRETSTEGASELAELWDGAGRGTFAAALATGGPQIGSLGAAVPPRVGESEATALAGRVSVAEDGAPSLEIKAGLKGTNPDVVGASLPQEGSTGAKRGGDSVGTVAAGGLLHPVVEAGFSDAAQGKLQALVAAGGQGLGTVTGSSTVATVDKEVTTVAVPVIDVSTFSVTLPDVPQVAASPVRSAAGPEISQAPSQPAVRTAVNGTAGLHAAAGESIATAAKVSPSTVKPVVVTSGDQVAVSAAPVANPDASGYAGNDGARVVVQQTGSAAVQANSAPDLARQVRVDDRVAVPGTAFGGAVQGRVGSTGTAAIAGATAGAVKDASKQEEAGRAKRLGSTPPDEANAAAEALVPASITPTEKASTVSAVMDAAANASSLSAAAPLSGALPVAVPTAAALDSVAAPLVASNDFGAVQTRSLRGESYGRAEAGAGGVRTTATGRNVAGEVANVGAGAGTASDVRAVVPVASGSNKVAVDAVPQAAIVEAKPDVANKPDANSGVDATALAAANGAAPFEVDAAVGSPVKAGEDRRVSAAAPAAGKERKVASAETKPGAAPVAADLVQGLVANAVSGVSAPSKAVTEHRVLGSDSSQTNAPVAGVVGTGSVLSHVVADAVASVVTPAAVAGAPKTETPVAPTGGADGIGQTGSMGDGLVSPMAHTTLSASPTVLEVGVPGGTHGWLKIRAEIGEGGAVQASMSASTHAGQDALRRDLPAMNAFLESEHVPVSVQVGHAPAASLGTSLADGSAAAKDGGLSLGAGLGQSLTQGQGQDAPGSGRAEAGAGILAGGDAAGQGPGRQDGGNANAQGGWVADGSGRTGSAGREVVADEAEWTSGSGYGSGARANGGSWLNVMA